MLKIKTVFKMNFTRGETFNKPTIFKNLLLIQWILSTEKKLNLLFLYD